MASSPRTLIVGLSGPSSSGKSTLARLLKTIFNTAESKPLFILHEDDFYKSDNAIPLVSTPHGQVQDWDCADAIDFPLLARTLKHVKDFGELPPDMYSKEDQNKLGESGVHDDAIKATQEDVRTWLSHLPAIPRICILDGFLLYGISFPSSITDLLDVRLFLRTTSFQTITRRKARAGYVTLEGFWEDPEGYVEEVVWPNYVREHQWMFEGGDVDGGEVTGRVAKEGLLVGPGKGEESMTGLMGWAVWVLKERIEGVTKGKA